MSSSEDEKDIPEDMFHETQTLQLCAVHSVNNLFQKKLYKKSDFDEMCYNLSKKWINPHKSIWGTGNYDVNIIITAIQLQQHKVVWFDKRKGVEGIDFVNTVGMIINQTGSTFFGLKQTKHWFTISKINNNFYNSDSNLKKPKLIPKENLEDFFQNILYEVNGSDHNQLLLIFKEDHCFENDNVDDDSKQNGLDSESNCNDDSNDEEYDSEDYKVVKKDLKKNNNNNQIEEDVNNKNDVDNEDELSSIIKLLNDLDLDDYIDDFKNNNIVDYNSFLLLSEDDIKNKLNIQNSDHCDKILNQINEMKILKSNPKKK
eukprot:TRINITY_DN3844_c0_g1_i2.p1 TRINITY_DN3844_c0_g1~~TRINITY_DN3844_c0_g1_i2.p1  ORF type:complete len:315 (-),score=88.45 TRINITY_DN3844_c0_g1_i2:102-1046(-)